MDRTDTRRRTPAHVLLIAALAVLLSPTGAAHARAAVTQPRQPASGPGGSAYTHAGVRVTQGGAGAGAWYLFEPTGPGPVSAPLAIVTHGYYEYAGYRSMSGLIRHTVRAGNVVIYTRWQTAVATPCPGPIDIEPCMRSEVRGIRGALAFLKAHPDRVQPQLARTSYFGFSFGGIITANLASRYRTLGVPKPRAVFLEDPHDGALTGPDEPALDDSLAGIPPTTLFECHDGAEGVIAQFRQGGCNAVFPKLTSVPARNKDLVLTSHDAHGQPALSSTHGVCAGSPGGPLAIDAYDWGFCWKVWDALRSCAYAKVNCRYALGDSPEHRFIGTWSDGVPIIGLKVKDAAPIGPRPVPARLRAPRTRPAMDRPPRGRIAAVRRSGRVVTLTGTASDDHGVARVEVLVVRRTGGTCRQLTPAGHLVALPGCGRATSPLTAAGTTRWSLRLPAGLPRGAYRAFVLVTDSAGQQPAREASRQIGIG